MRSRPGLLRSVPLLVLCSGMFPSAGGVSADEFRSTWHNDLDRTWVGRDYHANRWQDWRVENGRLECLESGKRLPMRTVQVLPEVLDPMNGRADLSVGLGEIEFEAPCADNAWAGLLIGSGGPDIDYRRTALVHHLPAEDGGIMVVVDGRGVVSIRDNERAVRGRSTWVISGDVDGSDLPTLPGMTSRIEIDEYRMRKIFEPGFTSKSRGWGLGLSLAKRIIEEYHGGKLTLEQSIPGEGTTFKISLPIA